MVMRIVILVLALICGVRSQSKADLKQLHDDLFVHSAYDKTIRPADDQNDAVVVYIYYFLQSINEIDEIKETMTTTGYLLIQWTDSGLSWIPSDYNGIDFIYVPQNQIWKPDILLANSNAKAVEIGGSFYYVAVDSNGDVWWYPYERFTTKCPIDMTYYPNDKQNCDISLTVWSYDSEDVWIADDSYFGLEDIEGHSIWTVENSSHSIGYDSAGQRKIDFTINLRRKPMFYVLNVLVPIIVLSCISTIVFIIPADAGEKIGFSVTVFLSFAVFLTIISAQLPTNSENTALISVYIITEVFCSVLALLVSAIQLRLRHRDGREVGRCYVVLIKMSRCLRCHCCKRKKKNSVSPSIEKNQPINDAVIVDDDDDDFNVYSWLEVCNAIDVLGFFTFCMINLSATGVIFGFLFLQ